MKTRNGGFQLYFENSGIAANRNLHYGDVKIGELRAHWEYVVAVGSFVPTDKKATPDATGDYTVFRNVPLKVLHPDQIPGWIKVERTKAPSKVDQRTTKKLAAYFAAPSTDKMPENGFTNRWGISLTDVVSGGSDFGKELGEYLCGADCTGDCNSRSEADFRTVKILWKFYFDIVDIAQILQHFRPYEKTMREDYLQRTISGAIEDALARGWKREVPSNDIPLPLTGINTKFVGILKDVVLDCRYGLIRGIPRIGKTHWGDEQLLNLPHGNYVSHRDSILRHAIGIFKDLNKSGRSAVLVIGKDACCPRDGDEKGHCESCDKRIKTHEDDAVGISNHQYFKEAAKLLREKTVLTPEDVPSDLCPYFILRFAEKRADFCFTVPYYLSNEDHSVEVKPRFMTIIDEDPTVDYFYPKTLALAEFHTDQGKEKNAKNFVHDFLPGLTALKERITSQHQRDRYDKAILAIIDLVTEKINPLIENLVDHASDENKEAIIGHLNDVFTHTVAEKDRYNVLRRIKHHLSEMRFGSGISVSDIFEPLLYPAQNKFIWLGRNPNSLYIVGERKIIRQPKLDHLVVIGATNAELFVEELSAGAPQDARIYDVTEFPYRQNFIVFRLVGESKKQEDRMMRMVIQLLAENNRKRDDRVPALILTSSKKNQLRVWDHLKSVAIMSRDDKEDDLIGNWIDAKFIVYYTNSNMSRGVDVPYYDILCVHSCTFAQPYWESMIQLASTNNDEDQEFRARIILNRLIGDELTNSVLRHSPIRGVHEDQVKIIVVTSQDYEKIASKVTTEMELCEIRNDKELKWMAAALPEFATRPSKSAVREKVGFNTIYDLPLQHSTKLRSRVSARHSYRFRQNPPRCEGRY